MVEREKNMQENENLNREEEIKAEQTEDTVVADEETPTVDDNTAADEETKDKTLFGAKDKKKIKKLEQELADAGDKYARLYAEYDNFRKRSAKELEGRYADAYVDALTQILPILDNLDRAAQFSDADAESPMAKGLEMTRRSFVETLAKMGVSEIEALGKTFDPNLHNAVMHVEDENAGENEIVEVFMKGYIRGDRVLRYAMVKVAN